MFANTAHNPSGQRSRTRNWTGNHAPVPALVVAAIVASGCSNDVDTERSNLPYQSDIPEVIGDLQEVATGDCDCLVPGTFFLFDTLELTSIGGFSDHGVMTTLNPLWKADMAKCELNIVAEVLEVTATAVSMRLLNAARMGLCHTCDEQPCEPEPCGAKDMCLLNETAIIVDFPRDGCQLGPSAETNIRVYAGDETHPKNCTTVLAAKHAIPVDRAALSVTVSSDCQQMVAGNVPQGVIGESELGQICTCLAVGASCSDTCGTLDSAYQNEAGLCKGCNASYTNLGALLGAFVPKLPFECQTSNGTPGVCLSAGFSMRAMTSAPAVCGGG